MTPSTRLVLSLASLTFVAAACSDGGDDPTPPAGTHDPASADRAAPDRFSATAGHLMVRTPDNGLPAANAPIDFDVGPFMTEGLGPDGTPVAYYNFDVQPTTPADIYVLFEEGAAEPLAGQLNIVDALPGEAGYSDFWRVTRVDVPVGTAANTYASRAELVDAGLAMTPTDMIVNCPVVPEGSSASRRGGGGGTALHEGWYRGEVVHYFTFEEAPLVADAAMVPTSPIFVTFNVNAGEDGGGPPSGFVTEGATTQTHNVVGTVPGDAGYSPLWAVQIYDNVAFDDVMDLASATAAPLLVPNAATVNCPVVD